MLDIRVSVENAPTKQLSTREDILTFWKFLGGYLKLTEGGQNPSPQQTVSVAEKTQVVRGWHVPVGKRLLDYLTKILADCPEGKTCPQLACLAAKMGWETTSNEPT